MPELMNATPAQRSVLNELCQKHTGAPCWIKYSPETSKGMVSALFFMPKYLFEYHITPDGYIKGETAYDNPQHIQASNRGY